MASIQQILDELPFPAIGITEDGEIVENELAVKARVVAWLKDKPPEAIRQFLNKEANKVSRVRCEVDGKAVVASGRWMSGGLSRILRLIPQL